MAPPSNVPWLHLGEMAFVSVTPDDIDVFSLRSSNFMHESTSFLDCVIEGNGRNEGTVHFIPYRALHAGRTALIGRHRRMSPDYTSDEMAFVAVTPDHIDVFSCGSIL